MRIGPNRFRSPHGRARRPTFRPLRSRSSAGLPFAAEEADRHLAHGVADELAASLSRFRDLVVIARRSRSRYGSDADLVRAATELDARFVVTGGVDRGEDGIRVSVRLVGAQTGAIRWTDRYEGALTSLPELQDRVAERMIGAFVARARHAALEHARSRPAASLEGYELVLKARLALAAYGSKTVNDALALLERALRLDPRDAAALTLIAHANLKVYLHPLDGRFQSPATLQRALDAALAAVELDPDSSTAQAALGYTRLWERRYDDGVAALRRAVELNPNDATALFWYGDALSRNGDHRSAVDALERSLRLDPFAPSIVVSTLARAHLMLGDRERALAISRDCVDRSANTAMYCLLVRAIAARELGHDDEARAARDGLLGTVPGYAISRYVRRFREDHDESTFIAYLRRAGFPE